MEFAENEFISSVDELSSNVEELCSKVPIISDYWKSLDGNVTRRCLEKVAVIAVDPITIPDEHFSSECLPAVEATDLLSYLVLETSFYTKQQFKAYKSLEAYNFMVSGFITSVQGCVVREKYIVTRKVRNSQRMNDPLMSIWVIADKDGTINSAHCLGCKARMAESCSHVASVLLYIEAWTRILGKLSCTWLLPSYVKEVPYATVRDIYFSSARKLKADLDAKIDSIGERSEVCVASHGSNLRTIQVPTLSEMNSLCRQLNKGKVKPVALSLIKPYSDQFVLKSRQILTISGLFDPENVSLSYPDLLKNALT